MPLFLCNPQSSFCSNLIQLSRQQEAEGSMHTALLSCSLSHLPPAPYSASNTHPHGTASSFSCHLFQNILFSLIYISPVKQDLGAVPWPHLLLSRVHLLLTEVLGLAAWWGFCVHPEARGCSNICRTHSSLERFSAKLHKLCVRCGLCRDLLLSARSLCSLSLGC